MTDTQRCGRCKESKPLDDFQPWSRGKSGQPCRACRHDSQLALRLERNNQGVRLCPVCSSPLSVHKRANAVTCSDECSVAHFITKDSAKRSEGRNKLPRVCLHCWSILPPTKRAGVLFCSRKCVKDYSNAKVSAALREQRRQLNRLCLWCGSEVPREKDIRTKFCSRSCMYRANAVARGFPKRTGESGGRSLKSIRTDLFARDGYVCYLCDREMDLTVRHPDPLSVSIDHVLAISRGGTNDYCNLRLTHLICNLRKGPKLVEELVAA